MTTTLTRIMSIKFSNYVLLYIEIHFNAKNPEINNKELQIHFRAVLDFV